MTIPDLCSMALDAGDVEGLRLAAECAAALKILEMRRSGGTVKDSLTVQDEELTAQQVAEDLKLPRFKSVYKLALRHRDPLPSYRLGPKQFRVRRSLFEAWKARQVEYRG